MNNLNPSVGDTVSRIAKDYTGGRTGKVIETKESRARIHWTAEKDGSPMNLRTWVRFQDLQITKLANSFDQEKEDACK
jgi:hypothetical protein